MVVFPAKMARSEAEGHGNLERPKLGKHMIEPGLGVRAVCVGPAQTGAQVRHVALAHPADGIIEPVILPVKPLAQTDRAVQREVCRSQLGCAIVLEQVQVAGDVVLG